MSILKIKDNQNNWIQLPVLKGQTGSTGPQGPRGESGVYIGTDEPIDENVNVWIDSDGTVDDIPTISEIFNSFVSVEGTTPTIVAKSGVRYICGEIIALDFTPSTSGICDVVFTSGSTPTILTIPDTIKWANKFNPSSLEANTIYEINIMNGLGVCASWT